jgi:hypothetical protein
VKAIQKEINITTDKHVSLIPLSDLHCGNIGCDVEKIKGTIQWIKDNGAYTILLGDMIDAITQKDPRHENDSIHPYFMDKLDNLAHEQTMYVVELLKPIKNQIIATMGGNHEGAVKKHFSYDSAKVLADTLGIPLITDPSIVRIRLRRSTTATMAYDIWCSHGVGLGGGKMIGGKANNLVKVAGGFHADCYMAGHTHSLLTFSDIYMFANSRGNVVARKRIYINTGSFQKTYDLPDGVDTWASRTGFMPARTGTARLDLYLKRDNNKYRIDAHARA